MGQMIMGYGEFNWESNMEEFDWIKWLRKVI